MPFTSVSVDRLRVSDEWLRRGRKSDAWATVGSSISKNDRFVEAVYPLYASRAKGAYLWDVDGNRYIDYILGYGTIILGHADDRVTDAVVAELRSGNCLSPFWRSVQVELTETLTTVIPDAEMAFLMRTGSDATSGAVRLARIFTGRSKVVRWGYQGWHDWCAPPLGVPESVQRETLTFRYNDFDSLEAVLKAHRGDVACVVMMPFELEPPRPGGLQEVRALAHHHGALFVLDEMRSGFRMALGGAQQFFEVRADIATFSKAMANGHAISAVVGRADVLSCMARTQMVSAFYTSAPEMAASMATISILRDTPALSDVWAMGRLFQDGLRAQVSEYGVSAEVQGYPPCPYLQFTYADPEVREAARIAFYSQTTNNGILLHPSHHWYVSASHTRADIEATLAVCRKGFEAARAALQC